MGFSDNEMHVVAIVGACMLTVALSVPTVMLGGDGSDGEDDSDKPDDKHLVIRAELAMLKTSDIKQPQKPTTDPVPKPKDVGVSHDPDKIAPKQCCTNEADCNQAGLAVGTRCADGSSCEHNQCVKQRVAKTTDDPATKIPDRTTNVDDPVGKPTPNTQGAFDGNKHGTAKANTGDPWFGALNTQFFGFLEFNKLDDAKGAQPCVRMTADGKIEDTEFKKKSDNDDLNNRIEVALRKLKEARNQNPVPVPSHLINEVTTQWRCFPVDDLSAVH